MGAGVRDAFLPPIFFVRAGLWCVCVGLKACDAWGGSGLLPLVRQTQKQALLRANSYWLTTQTSANSAKIYDR